MTNTMRLEIVSAEQQIFSGLVAMVVVTGELGEIGVAPGHAPLLTVLKPGEIRITFPDGDTANQEIYYVQGGMMEVQPLCVTVLADVVERADHLDEAAALEAKARAEAAMAGTSGDMDYSVAAIELARAVAQIRALQKFRKKI